MSSFATNARKVLPLPRTLGLVRRVFSFGPRPRLEETSPDDARARREFIWEMLARNPAAFSSDADVQGMMGMFPGRF